MSKEYLRCLESAFLEQYGFNGALNIVKKIPINLHHFLNPILK